MALNRAEIFYESVARGGNREASTQVVSGGQLFTCRWVVFWKLYAIMSVSPNSFP